MRLRCLFASKPLRIWRKPLDMTTLMLPPCSIYLRLYTGTRTSTRRQQIC